VRMRCISPVTNLLGSLEDCVTHGFAVKGARTSRNSLIMPGRTSTASHQVDTCRKEVIYPFYCTALLLRLHQEMFTPIYARISAIKGVLNFSLKILPQPEGSD